MTYAEIDRLFFEYLRKTLVSAGLLPDVATYETKEEFAAARKTLADSLRQMGLDLVDIFGVGAGDARGKNTGARITIGRGKQERGSVSVGQFPFKVKEGEKFTEYEHLDSNKTIRYEIRCISNKTEEERILMGLVDATLGQRRYMNTVGINGEFTAELVLVQWLGTSDVTATQDQRETLFQYEVVDVWVGAEKVLRNNIVPLTTVDYFVYSQDDANEVSHNTIVKP